ncbi:BTAD domain-containing putative transcriptional regulator [Streptosporangium oxazolinicum]|uniref:BTAD domain-containing putative transcriptional regulator n=1 Tax=Streptosporangium oxazolinicum TaxID=909287 RepID=A0ABP8AUP3_9ACTN
MVRIRLLGGVTAETDDGDPIDVGAARTRTLLAALALSPGVPVPVARLIEQVWADAPPRTVAKTLQWHVARLRAALGHAAIGRAGAAYRLDLPAEAVDVGRFRAHLRDGDAEAALAEWTGDPLAGVDAPGLASAVHGLVEERLGALESALEHQVDRDPHRAATTLTGLVARHPLREGLWALLMTALTRSGRRADALATYRRARRHLVAELGIEPGPRLRDLEARILREEEPREGNLPSRLSPLIGRDDALAAVAGALAGSPVVTLVGPGGIGKTRLALAAALRTGGAAWFLDLSEITDAADVPRVAAGTLGVAQRPGHGLTESVVAALASRTALLVVDNCEHVPDGAAGFVQAVARGCPHVRVLATSRERLAVDGEQVVAVDPLAPGAAAELFHTRASATDLGYDRLAHAADVADLCRHLDGIPLAIELAAARVRSHRPRDLLARPGAATGERRTGAPRHRSLHAALAWSHDLLTDAERVTLRDLSVFRGPFPLAAAAAVTGDDTLLGTLVERSMVATVPGPRFRLLEPIRRFAAAQGPTEEASGRHARWCLVEVAEIGALLRGIREEEGVARLRELWPNLRAAFGWACATGDVVTADALVRPVVTELTLRGTQEIGDWAERLLALLPPDQADRRAFWLLWAAERLTQTADPAAFAALAAPAAPDHPLARYAAAYVRGDGQALAELLPPAAAGLREREPYLAAFLRLNAAGTLLGIGRFAQVDEAVTVLAARYRAEGPPTLHHWALQTLAYSAAFQRRPGDAERFFDEAATIDLPEGSLSAGKAVQARAAFRRGDHPRAYRLLRGYIDELVATGNVVAASVVCIEFVTMTAALGLREEAERMLAYLESRNEFGAMAARLLVPYAVGGRAADPGLTDRQALDYMGAVLDRLTTGQERGSTGR